MMDRDLCGSSMAQERKMNESVVSVEVAEAHGVIGLTSNSSGWWLESNNRQSCIKSFKWPTKRSILS